MRRRKKEKAKWKNSLVEWAARVVDAVDGGGGH